MLVDGLISTPRLFAFAKNINMQGLCVSNPFPFISVFYFFNHLSIFIMFLLFTFFLLFYCLSRLFLVFLSLLSFFPFVFSTEKKNPIEAPSWFRKVFFKQKNVFIAKQHPKIYAFLFFSWLSIYFFSFSSFVFSWNRFKIFFFSSTFML